jgi:hypothetical protein
VSEPESCDVVRTAQSSSTPVGDRWAIVVGISQYEDPTLNIKYADRDAQEFYKLIRTPWGGGFKEQNVQYVLNDAATIASVTAAFRGSSPEAQEQPKQTMHFAR